ncbi:peptide deformylase [Gammaproteobacteria bacterium]|nr:peptide deformylase [Gammaproteobacteria bacterium]
MSVLKIITIPHPTLKKIAKLVTKFNAELEQFVNDMIETMYAEDGVGLAANQVNILKRIVVVDCSDERNEPLALINPVITPLSDEIEDLEEGCLSIPEMRAGPISRYTHIRVDAQNINGEPISFEAEFFLARCIQHEVDHLEGKVYIDYLSPLKRERLIVKMKKLQKEKEMEEQDEL